MKLVVLGNGFDLGSGLPTSYKDYFKNYNSKNNVTLKHVENFLSMEVKSEIKHGHSHTNIKSNYHNREKEIFQKLSSHIELICSVACETNMSIWNLYFWFSDKNSNQNDKNYNWSDVENQIYRLIEDFSIITFLDNSQKISEIEIKLSDFLKEINIGSYNSVSTSDVENYLNNIYFKFEKKDRFRYICDSIVSKRYGLDCELDYLSILKRELVLFEENFRGYITNISETRINNNNKNKRIYRDNFFNVTNDKEDSFFIINFNYTDFSSNKKKDNVLITRDKKKINVKQMNVHGVYYSKIIFGIDQTDQDKEKMYQFTKTYRKMELYNEISSTKLPKPQEIDEIIIYGHSLSIADYSYFHSLFDYYDIYGSDIIVSFTYSLYGNESNYGNIKNGNVQKIMKLLKFYGDKMFDRERGKNLVHKMLLENRLIIREIVLDSLE